MKNYLNKVLWLLLVMFLITGANAQTTTKKTSTKTKSTKSKTAAPVSKSTPVPVTITLTSKCERNLMIFSGPKENLRDPKMRQIGGLSVNMLYLKTNQVVCIMDAKKKPASCVTVTKQMSKLETNNAGTALVVP
ncbi:MAG: hypothetical protein V4615_13265 [Bacteroidota bacterium]